MKGKVGGRGNHNSGRKSVRKEYEQLLWILDRWMNGKEVKKILEKRAKGKTLSLRETYVARAAEGSDVILNKLSDKILPDKLDLPDDSKVIMISLDQ